MIYQNQSKQLLKLVDQDQKELRDLGQSLKSLNTLDEKLKRIKLTAITCQENAQKMLEIIKAVDEPSISSIGEDASNAVILLALHSQIEVMEHVRDVFETIHKRNKADVPLSYLAVLIDRIEIIKTRQQILGTTTFEEEGQEFLIPIKDVDQIDQKRADYELKPLDSKLTVKNIPEDIYALSFAYMDRSII